MTKIDIVSGFLGAGKTTLIKKLLKDALAGTRVVLIENEFGEIGIDGGFLKESGIEIREMNSGCICCSLVGDFGTSLREVMDTYAPERILIEPSGVGKLSDVMKAIRDAAEGSDMELNSAVAVVDASKCKIYIKNFGEFFVNQIEYAGTIILTRTDKVSDAKIAECVELLRQHNDKATIITTPIAELDGKQILTTIEGKADLQAQILAEVMEEHDDEDEHEHHHHHHDDEDEHEHHHHHHDDDDDEDEHEHHHHHHHDDDDEDEHEHHHHHDHDHEHAEVVVDEKGNRIYRSHDHHHHHHHHGGHDADEIFVSWGMETPARYSQDEIREILAQLDDEEKYGIVLRSKGMVPDAEGRWVHFDYVPEETEVRYGAADVTGKICVIGAQLKEDALAEFLDSGKSSFFSYTIAQPYFQTSGTTLLIVCEEGEVEYGERLLRQTNTVMEVFENEEDLTPSAMMALEVKYRPERILIEYNGMWNYKNFRLPRAWRLEQQITVIDASTFSVYFTNMRSLLAEQLRGSELIMFNRCDGIDEKTLVSYKRNVKAINQQADLIFEDSNGEIDMTTEEDLPYDIHKEPIVLEDLNYGIWYLDAMEHPDRYDGKEIEYTGMVMVPDKFPKGYFVPGRMAMTCCANDMSFLGYACKSEQGKSFPERTWVRVRARVSYESFSEYDGEGIVLYAESVEETRQPKEPVINFAG